MLCSLHAVSIMYTNLLTDIRIARQTGFDGLDIRVPKLERYLAAGYSVQDLLPALGSLHATQLCALEGIEHQDPEVRRDLLRRCETLSAVAQALHCPSLQVIALDALQGDPWPMMRAKIARSVAELADIAGRYGIRLAIEPVAVAPMRTLAQGLEVIDAAGRDNVGLCLDTFHLWAGGTTWEEVAALQPRLIAGAHIGEATTPKGHRWTDDDRAALPGDGILPMREAIAAIRATGFDGVWSFEVYSPYHWEWDPVLLATEIRRRARTLLGR